MNSRLLSLVSTLLLCLIGQFKVSAQYGNYVVNVPENVVFVNGTLTITGNGNWDGYYVGYGDSLILNNANYVSFYVDNGGYVKVNGNSGAGYATSFATVDVTSGTIDSLFIDYPLTNMIGWNNNTWIISPMHFSFTTHLSDLGYFKSIAQKKCDGPYVTIHSSSAYVGMNIITDHGDGIIDTTVLQQASNPDKSYAVVYYPYVQADTYNVKQVLCNNVERIDSMSFGYIQVNCSEMSITFYSDVNSNCVYEQGQDELIQIPLKVQIDTNGIIIDTVSATSGLVYKAYGNPSASYSFKIVDFPGDMIASCPVNGTISEPFQQGIKPTSYLGFECPGSGTYDLGINVTSRAGTHRLSSFVNVQNSYCVPQNVVLTMNYDPVYTVCFCHPQPNSIGGGVATWNLGMVSGSINIPVSIDLDGASLATGIPVTTTYSVSPTINDVNPSDNSIVVIDTTEGSWDPNAVYVKPEGCTPAGSTLEYTITFENLGNGVAENIYILDTLPRQLDPKSIELLFTSHSMFIETTPFGRATVVKFNFPNIMLPDSSDHLGRHGSVKFNVNVRPGLPFGTNFQNRAGIYFDYNPPVLTNTAYNAICWPASVNESVLAQKAISIYPNPATDELTIKTEQAYSSYTITNSIGQVMMYGEMKDKESKVNIKSLATGIYYISLEGPGGTEVRKFVKL